MTSVHPWDDVRIYHKECRTLAAAGYDVYLIAPKEVPEESLEERTGDVKVIGVRRRRGRIWRMSLTTLEVLKHAIRLRADIYHFHDPELIPVGVLLRLLGKRVIYDVHEDVPKQILSKTWIPSGFRGTVAKSAHLVEMVAARLLSGFVAATPSIAKRYPAPKTVVVHNFPLLRELSGELLQPYGERPNNVAYVGGIWASRGAVEMVRAMEFLPPELSVRLILAGAFDSALLESEVRRLFGWTRVDFLGWIGRQEVARVLNTARVGLVVFHPEPNHLFALPNKLFEYMAAGIPVVASDFPLWRQIIGDCKCGLLVDPLNPKAIADAIAWLLKHPEEAEVMGSRGREAVLKRFNWEREAEKLWRFYEGDL
jgi:glycosyltransferase involved in cell wall biosynthesis